MKKEKVMGLLGVAVSVPTDAGTAALILYEGKCNLTGSFKKSFAVLPKFLCGVPVTLNI